MKLLVYIRTVLWGFIGIGSGAKNREDLAKVKPFGLFAVAVALVGVFLVTVLGLANLAVSTLK